MPAFHSKMRCIGYATEPAPKKPHVKKVLDRRGKGRGSCQMRYQQAFEGEQEGVGEYPEALGGQ